MKDFHQVINQAEKRCKENGSRLTLKRRHVLLLLLQAGKALSAYELIDAYKAEFGDTLPAMSMYRFLEFLATEHLVHRLELANKYVACKGMNCTSEEMVSQFLICRQCRKVHEINISQPAMMEFKKNIKDAGFRMTNMQLEMSGICETCTSNMT